jgi:hypothetical protein
MTQYACVTARSYVAAHGASSGATDAVSVSDAKVCCGLGRLVYGRSVVVRLSTLSPALTAAGSAIGAVTVTYGWVS